MTPEQEAQLKRLADMAEDESARRADMAGDRLTFGDAFLGALYVLTFAAMVVLLVRGWQ